MVLTLVNTQSGQHWQRSSGVESKCLAKSVASTPFNCITLSKLREKLRVTHYRQQPLNVALFGHNGRYIAQCIAGALTGADAIGAERS